MGKRNSPNLCELRIQSGHVPIARHFLPTSPVQAIAGTIQVVPDPYFAAKIQWFFAQSGDCKSNRIERVKFPIFTQMNLDCG